MRRLKTVPGEKIERQIVGKSKWQSGKVAARPAGEPIQEARRSHRQEAGRIEARNWELKSSRHAGE